MRYLLRIEKCDCVMEAPKIWEQKLIKMGLFKDYSKDKWRCQRLIWKEDDESLEIVEHSRFLGEHSNGR